MSHELIIAMNVTDPEIYAKYRAGIAPILAKHSGRFTHDFEVARVLTSVASHPITRVFVLSFRDRAAREAFFADPEYGAVRAEHFVKSVDGFTVLAETDRA